MRDPFQCRRNRSECTRLHINAFRLKRFKKRISGQRWGGANTVSPGSLETTLSRSVPLTSDWSRLGKGRGFPFVMAHSHERADVTPDAVALRPAIAPPTAATGLGSLLRGTRLSLSVRPGRRCLARPYRRHGSAFAPSGLCTGKPAGAGRHRRWAQLPGGRGRSPTDLGAREPGRWRRRGGRGAALESHPSRAAPARPRWPTASGKEAGASGSDATPLTLRPSLPVPSRSAPISYCKPGPSELTAANKYRIPMDILNGPVRDEGPRARRRQLL